METQHETDLTESMSRVLTSLAKATNTESPSEPKWPALIDRVKLVMEQDGVDDALPHFERLFAKIATRELKSKDSPYPQGVMLCGVTGNGKTFRLKFMERHLSGMHMTTAVELVEKIEKNDSIDFFKDITRTDTGTLDIVPKRYYDLIIDDIGFEKTESVNYGNRRDIMERVILARYMVFPEHQTHFSTNLTEDQLKERYGDRIYSRLREMCLFVTMKGEDRRTTR